MKKFIVPFYSIELWLGYKTKLSTIKRVLKADSVDDWSDSDGRTDYFEDDLSTLAVSFKSKDAGTIAHEAIHIKNIIYRRIGATLDLKNDEPEAYLVGWLVDTITTYLNSV